MHRRAPQWQPRAKLVTAGDDVAIVPAAIHRRAIEVFSVGVEARDKASIGQQRLRQRRRSHRIRADAILSTPTGRFGVLNAALAQQDFDKRGERALSGVAANDGVNEGAAGQRLEDVLRRVVVAPDDDRADTLRGRWQAPGRRKHGVKTEIPTRSGCHVRITSAISLVLRSVPSASLTFADGTVAVTQLPMRQMPSGW